MTETHQKRRKKKGGQKASRSNQTGPKTGVQENLNLIPQNRDEVRNVKQILPKKSAEKRSEKISKISGYIDIAVQFLRDSKTELKKVKWPTRKELMASTAMVIILVLAIAFFLGVIDFGLIKIIKVFIG